MLLKAEAASWPLIGAILILTSLARTHGPIVVVPFPEDVCIALCGERRVHDDVVQVGYAVFTWKEGGDECGCWCVSYSRRAEVDELDRESC